MPVAVEPRGIFVDALWRLDLAETKKRLALVRAACRAASIEAGGKAVELDAALARVDGDLLYAAQRAVEVLATELAMHERDRGPPPDTPVAVPSPPPFRGARLPRLTPRTP